MRLPKLTIVIFTCFFLGACASRQVAAPVLTPGPTITWSQLAPYVARHIGMRANAQQNYTFDIGGDFGTLDPSLSPKIDGQVAEALRRNRSPLAGIILPVVTTDQLVKPARNRDGSRQPLDQAALDETAARIWQAIIRQDPPVVLTHIKFVMARELAGSLNIAEMNLQPTLSSQDKIRWHEVEGYVSAFLRLTLVPNQTGEKNLGVRICMTDNHLSDLSAAEIDWPVAMAVFDGLVKQMGESTPFQDRTDELLAPAAAQVKSVSAAQQSTMLAQLEKKFRRQFMTDYILRQNTKAYLANQFSQAKLPPLVD